MRFRLPFEKKLRYIAGKGQEEETSLHRRTGWLLPHPQAKTKGKKGKGRERQRPNTKGTKGRTNAKTRLNRKKKKLRYIGGKGQVGYCRTPKQKQKETEGKEGSVKGQTQRRRANSGPKAGQTNSKLDYSGLEANTQKRRQTSNRTDRKPDSKPLATNQRPPANKLLKELYG